MTTDTNYQIRSQVVHLCRVCVQPACAAGLNAELGEGKMLSAARINEAKCGSCQPCVLPPWNWVLGSGTSAEDWPEAAVLQLLCELQFCPCTALLSMFQSELTSSSLFKLYPSLEKTKQTPDYLKCLLNSNYS